MKKLFLYSIVFCLLFTGCTNKTETPPSPSSEVKQDASVGTLSPEADTAPAHTDGEPLLATQYIDIIKSDDYYMKARVEGENGVNQFSVSVSPDSTAMETEMEGALYTVVIRDGVTYMINHDSKMIITSSAEVASSASNMAGDALETEGLVFEKKDTGTFGGETLSYEAYIMPGGGTMRFYFRQNTLVGIESTSAGITDSYMIEALSAGHRENMHVIPDSYQLLDMAALGG